MKRIDFWFSIGSTYTYLTVMRLSDIGRESGVEFNWRPFSVRAIMQDMNNIPFAGKPAKEKYMWRDIQRRAAARGLEPEIPVAYPLKEFDRANRIAILAASEGWCAEYVRQTYVYWFEHGMPAGGDENVGRALQDVGQSADRVLEASASAAVERAYRGATQEAAALGIFGSPSFIVDGTELFWGDDRLEDAVRFCLD